MEAIIIDLIRKMNEVDNDTNKNKLKLIAIIIGIYDYTIIEPKEPSSTFQNLNNNAIDNKS